MTQLKFTLNLRFFIYLFLILSIPVLVFLYKDNIYTYFRSYVNNPYNLRVTNLGDRSATVTWYTKTVDTGFVMLNGTRHYDDRDVLAAQNEVKVNEVVDVKNYGKYFVHHVTLKNLKPDTTYTFTVANDLKEWKDKDLGKETQWYDLPVLTAQSFTTFKKDQNGVTAPQLAFGKSTVERKNGEVKPSNDSLIFAQAYFGELDGEKRDLDTPQSLINSSVTNSEGGWTIDKSSLRSESGEKVSGMQIGVDRILIYAQLANLKTAPGRYLSWGIDDAPDQDLNYKEWDDVNTDLAYNRSYFTTKTFAQEATTADTDPNLCCALKIGGRTDFVGDFENDVPGKGCEIFDAAFMGKSLYGGTYEGSQEIRGPKSYPECERTWTQAQIDAINALSPLPTTPTTPTPTTPTPTTPNPTTPNPTTPNPTTPSTPNVVRDPADVAQSGNICCIIKFDGISKPYRDFENEVDNKSCYDLFKNSKKDGKSVVSIKQDPGGRANQNACINSSTPPAPSGPNTPGGSVGISCDTTVPNQEVEGIDKGEFAEVCYRGIYNRGRTFANECYNDVVYRSRLAGMNPKLSLITWMHESACSNYEAAGKVYDMGIDWGDRSRMSSVNESFFDEQLHDFVCRDHKSTYHCPNISDEMLEWATVYRTGGCHKGNSNCVCSANQINEGTKWLNDLKAEWVWFADIDDFPDSIKDFNKDNYCDNQTRYLETGGGNSFSFIEKVKNFGKSFAQESTGHEFIKTDPNGDKYTLFFTEEGMYDIEVDGVKTYSVVATTGNKFEFYKEKNNTSGYQEGADERIEITLDKIRVAKVTNTFAYDLQKGFNVVSFPFLPTKDKFSPLQASEFIALANQSSPGTIKGVIEFDDGNWSNAFVYDPINKSNMGTDFTMTYGRGYAILTNRGGRVLIPGTNIIDPIPVTLESGWNLVAVHGYEESYTAQSLVTSMNDVAGVSVESITSWDKAKGRYDTFQVKGDEIFGFDYAIDPEQGYFIKLNTTTDADTLIWQGE